MRASLVVAAHNEGDRLVKTVRSCLPEAEALGGELVVVDDASTDGSVAALRREHPRVPVVAHARRRGVAATRRSGARAARGAVLLFLDGHCRPEPGALERLVAGVEAADGEAVLTPRLAVLDAGGWENRLEDRVGHGFQMSLETLDRYWVDRGAMRPVAGPAGRTLYECPALAGCCLAVGRRLYRTLRGFDAGMCGWGAEDLDFGLKAWLLGRPILHDPESVVGHWFRERFDNYRVRHEQVVANQLRMARKHFGEAAWRDWLRRSRDRHPGLAWGEIWGRFERGRAGVERERADLMARRVRDEFWYAARFGLWWPLWLTGRGPAPHPEEPPPDGPDGLFRAHADRPRNRGVPDGPSLAGSARPVAGPTLTLSLVLGRVRSGTVYVERAYFRWGRGATAAGVACGSWLTSRIEGEPLASVRTVAAAELRAALGLTPWNAPDDPAGTAIAALRNALENL